MTVPRGHPSRGWAVGTRPESCAAGMSIAAGRTTGRGCGRREACCTRGTLPPPRRFWLVFTIPPGGCARCAPRSCGGAASPPRRRFSIGCLTTASLASVWRPRQRLRRRDDPWDDVGLEHRDHAHGGGEDQAVADHAAEDVALGAHLVHAGR